jgi:hypothetical protein
MKIDEIEGMLRAAKFRTEDYLSKDGTVKAMYKMGYAGFDIDEEKTKLVAKQIKEQKSACTDKFEEAGVYLKLLAPVTIIYIIEDENYKWILPFSQDELWEKIDRIYVYNVLVEITGYNLHHCILGLIDEHENFSAKQYGIILRRICRTIEFV